VVVADSGGFPRTTVDKGADDGPVELPEDVPEADCFMVEVLLVICCLFTCASVPFGGGKKEDYDGATTQQQATEGNSHREARKRVHNQKSEPKEGPAVSRRKAIRPIRKG